MKLESNLNPEQRVAVLHEGGPLMILAGAGSGKTRVITQRIAHLIAERDVPPWRILAVTFTNKATGEMRERVEKLCGETRGMWISTFHALGARLLRMNAELAGRTRDFIIYDDDDQKRLGRKLMAELSMDPDTQKLRKLLSQVGRAKQKLKGPGEGGVGPGPIQVFYPRYQKALARANAFDFGDLIFQTNKLLDRHPEVARDLQERFSHVLVDEFQDTDRAQYRLLRKFCPPESELVVVGDDDQSIYGWRGAEISHIMGFARDYPGTKVVKLEQNYRSSANILNAAGAVIARNANRHEKKLWTDAEPGPPVALAAYRDERDEAQAVVQDMLAAREQGESLSEMAVFYRINAQSRALEEALRLYAVPYRVVGGTRFFDRMEIRDLLAYLRLLINPQSDVDLLRVLNVPARGLGPTSRDRLMKAALDADEPIHAILSNEHLGALRRAERGKVLAFRALLDDMRAQAKGRSAADAVRLALEISGYAKALEKQGEEDAWSRLENLNELVTAAEDVAEARDDDSLPVFLEHVALVAAVDKSAEGVDAATLMTLHAAKGLEFDRVYMVGMEEGMLPHRRSLQSHFDDDDDDSSPGHSLEEERRLCYVGMTRARKHLSLNLARSRSIFGRTEINPPSRFLGDLPEGKGTGGLATSGSGAALRAGSEQRGRLIDLGDGDIDLDEDDDMFVDMDDDDDLDEGFEDSVVDYDDEYSQVPSGAKPPGSDPVAWQGRRVMHSAFGRGRVRMASHGKAGVVKLVVVFESVGPKTVMANYVRLL